MAVLYFRHTNGLNLCKPDSSATAAATAATFIFSNFRWLRIPEVDTVQGTGDLPGADYAINLV